MHFYNIPAELSTASDPLATLRAVARPSDFVAFKVDIDGGPELEIVQAIADNRDGIAALVDELFFEYHFYFDNRNFGWATHRAGQNYRLWGNHSVDDALRLMRRLRERGIRAHFWI